MENQESFPPFHPEESSSWKNDRIFTALSSGYPVELFIELIELEASHLNHDETKMCKDAWHLISSDSTCPAGIWKSKVKYSTDDMSWDGIKADLMDQFGQSGAYTLDQKLELLQSLSKGETELYITFLFRVQWVLKCIGSYCSDKLLTKLLFLLGISHADKMYVLEKFKDVSEEKEDISGVVTMLDDPDTVVPKLKDEPFEDYNLDAFSEDVEPDHCPPKRRKKSRVKKESSLKKDSGREEFHSEDVKPKAKRNIKLKKEDEGSSVKEAKYIKASKSHMERAHLRTYHLSPGEDPALVKSLTCILMAVEDDVTKYYCGFCSSEYSTLADLNAHLKTFHNGFKYRCDLCSEYKGRNLEFVAQHRLQKHGAITETFQRYACNVDKCGFQTVNEATMEYHYNMLHSEEYAWKTQCNICGVRKESALLLRKHVETIHMNLHPFPCQLCEAGFNGQAGLDLHMERYHQAPPKPKVICTFCGSGYRNEYGLRDHIIRQHYEEATDQIPEHKRNQRHECMHCDKVFPQKHQLNRHMKNTHMEDSWIQCPRCDKKNKNGQHFRYHFLANHLKITIKPFSCTICGNSYVRDKDCWIHIAMKHELWSNEKSARDWKSLSREKPNLIGKRDVRKEERDALKGHIDDKYLPVMNT